MIEMQSFLNMVNPIQILFTIRMNPLQIVIVVNVKNVGNFVVKCVQGVVVDFAIFV